MKLRRFEATIKLGLSLTCALLLAACAVSVATQAKIDEYNRTIPNCSVQADCSAMWGAARAWVLENTDFPLRPDTENVIQTRVPVVQSQSGTSAKVERVALGNGRYEFRVSTTCYSTYDCTDEWDLGIDFNRKVSAAN